MNRTLVLARHAPTGNAKMHVISGTLDEPLSDDGRCQLDAYAAEYGPVSADVVLSSPLSRAVDTAIRLSGLPRERIEVWDELRDRNYGLLQGIAPEDVAAYRPNIEYISAGGIDHSVNPPGGETLDELRERAEQVAARLMGRNEPRILLVSHQAFMQQLGGVLMGLDIRQALASDIRVLQIDEYSWNGRLPATRTPIHGGVRALASW